MRATVEIDEPYRRAIADLDQFDYVWLVCWLDRPRDQGNIPDHVSPPFRSDGSTVSALATRCPWRASPIGMTLAQLEHLDRESGRMIVRGVDLADNTPVLDVKPYVPAFDRPPAGLPMTAGWYDEERLEAPLPNDAARSEAVEAALEWLEDGRPFVVVQLLEAPNVGAVLGGELCVATSDQVAGDLLRGALERDLPDFVAQALKTETSIASEIRANVPLAVRRGISQGEHQRVVAHPGSAIPPQFWSALRAGSPVTLAVSLDALPESSVVLEDDLVGPLASNQEVLAEARRLLEARAEARSTLEIGDKRVGFESFFPSPRLLLAGWPGLARVIAESARAVGWRTVSVSDAEIAVEIVQSMSKRDAVVVLVHERTLDEPVLQAALRDGGPGYVAAMGSKNVSANRRTRLGRIGVEPQQIERLKSPAGLPLGGRTPGEIALSIVAELQSTRYNSS